MRRRLLLVIGLAIGLLLLLGWLWSTEPHRVAAASHSRARASTAPPGPRRSTSRPRSPAPSGTATAPERAPLRDGWVACEVGNAFDGWDAVAVYELPPTGGDAFVALDLAIDDGVLSFAPRGSSGAGLLTWGEGRRQSSDVAWSGGQCRVSELPRPKDAAVFGRVRGAERLDGGSVFLEGCGVAPQGEGDALDADGGFFFPTTSGRCRLRAWRQAGALRLPGPWVEVDAVSGADADVDLEVPTFAPAGMGIGFRPSSEGVVVEQVHDGTPAWEAGLQAGDVISLINGEPTDGMGLEDFLQQGIGPAGTPVHLEGTSVDGEPFDLTFDRKPISLDRG